MNKTKRLLIAALLTASMFSGTVTYGAEAVSYTTEIETLTGLGLITGYSADNYLSRKSITANEFITAVVKMTERGEVSGDAVKLAKNKGFVKDGDGISSATPITYDQAVRVAVRTLGYEVWAENNGGNYIQTAGEIGLLKGVPASSGGNLTSDAMLRILYNMLHTEILEVVVSGGKTEYKQLDGTILEEHKGIKKGTGIVTANEFTDIYGADNGVYGYIGIEEEMFSVSDSRMNDYLGYSTDYWYTDDNGEYEIVCIVPDHSKNNEITVDSSLINQIKTNFSEISYYKSEKSSTLYKARLADNLKVIYNGKALSSYTADTLRARDGSIRLVDYDGDKRYDIVSVTSYELIKVSRVNAEDKTIFSEYKNIQPDSASKIDFDKLEEGKNLFVYSEGSVSELGSIPEGAVVLMTRSISGEDELVKLYVSSKTVSGTVTGINYELGEITCGEEKYKLNPSYTDVLHSGDASILKLKLGNTYLFSLDINGKISGAVLEGTVRSNEYVLVYKVIKDEDNEAVLLKYVDADDVNRVTKISSKAIIDGDSVSGDSSIYSRVKNIHAEIIEVSYNADGEIRTINRAVQRTDKTESDVFNCMPTETNLEYRSGAGTTSFGGKYYIDANTDLFITFDKDSNDDDDFAKVPLSRLYVSDQGKYTFTPYNIDEYGFAEIILLHSKEKTTTLDILVSGFEEKIDSDGDAVAILTGPVGSLVDVQVPTKTPEVYNGIKVGDYVSVSIDADGEATGYTTIYSPAGGRKYEYYIPHTFYHATRFAGDVESINYTKKRFKVVMPNLGKEKTLDYQWLVPTVFIYEDNTVEIGSVDDVVTGDFVVVTTSYDRPSTIVIYR